MCRSSFLRNIDAVKRLCEPSSFSLSHRCARVLGTVAAIAFFFATDSAYAQAKQKGGFFLPNADAAKIVTVTVAGEAAAGITVITEAVAVKENGSKATVNKFGEVYAFSPLFIAVRRDEPTQLEFWNLQPDDEHDVALLDADLKVLMYQKLPPLTKTSWVFTFHREGLFGFKCLVHQPEMSGQILVLPPTAR